MTDLKKRKNFTSVRIEFVFQRRLVKVGWRDHVGGYSTKKAAINDKDIHKLSYPKARVRVIQRITTDILVEE